MIYSLLHFFALVMAIATGYPLGVMLRRPDDRRL